MRNDTNPARHVLLGIAPVADRYFWRGFSGQASGADGLQPGATCGARVIPRLRDVVCELGMVPVPGFASVGNGAQAFSENGDLGDEQLAQGLNGLVQRLVNRAG